MGRLSGLLSLAMLGFSAASLPQKLDGLLAMKAGLDQQMLAQQDTILAAADAARDGGTSKPAQLTAEERQLAAEFSPQSQVLTTPIMGAILQASKSRGVSQLDASRWLLAAYQTFQQNQALFISVVWAAPAALLLPAGLLLALGFKGGTRFLADHCLSLSTWWLLALSAATAALFVAAKVNLWTTLPHDLWAVPAAAVLFSAGLLKLVDVNFPVWNAAFGALGAPLLSCVFILGFDRFAPLVRGLLG
jgi:hypothetical protein